MFHNNRSSAFQNFPFASNSRLYSYFCIIRNVYWALCQTNKKFQTFSFPFFVYILALLDKMKMSRKSLSDKITTIPANKRRIQWSFLFLLLYFMNPFIWIGLIMRQDSSDSRKRVWGRNRRNNSWKFNDIRTSGSYTHPFSGVLILFIIIPFKKVTLLITPSKLHIIFQVSDKQTSCSPFYIYT